MTALWRWRGLCLTAEDTEVREGWRQFLKVTQSESGNLGAQAHRPVLKGRHLQVQHGETYALGHLPPAKTSQWYNRSPILPLSGTYVKYRLFLTPEWISRAASEIILYGKKMNGPITYDEEKNTLLNMSQFAYQLTQPNILENDLNWVHNYCNTIFPQGCQNTWWFLLPSRLFYRCQRWGIWLLEASSKTHDKWRVAQREPQL